MKFQCVKLIFLLTLCFFYVSSAFDTDPTRRSLLRARPKPPTARGSRASEGRLRGTRQVIATTPGEPLWVVHSGRTNEAYDQTVRKMAVGGRDNIIATGLFEGYLTLGDLHVARKGGRFDGFVVKLDSTGSIVWHKTFGCTGGHYEDAPITSVAVDHHGNIFVSGWFSGNMTVDDATFVVSDDKYHEVFVAKLDPNGNIVWINTFLGYYWDRSSGIAVDSNQDVYVLGYFAENITIGGETIESDGEWDGFVVKLDSNGNTLLVKSFGGASANIWSSEIVVDDDGGMFVSGYFDGHMTIDDLSLENNRGAGVYDAFVVKFDSSGNALWAQSFGGTGQYNNVIDMALDSTGSDIFVTGYLGRVWPPPNSDIFIAKLGATDGAVRWKKEFPGNGSFAYGSGVVATTDGNILISGTFHGTLDLGGTILESSPAPPSIIPAPDVFVTKLESNGDHIWSKKFGGDGYDRGGAIAVLSDCSVVVSGSFNSTVQFGDTSIVSSHEDGDLDTFVAKITSERICTGGHESDSEGSSSDSDEGEGSNSDD